MLVEHLVLEASKNQRSFGTCSQCKLLRGYWQGFFVTDSGMNGKRQTNWKWCVDCLLKPRWPFWVDFTPKGILDEKLTSNIYSFFFNFLLPIPDTLWTVGRIKLSGSFLCNDFTNWIFWSLSVAIFFRCLWKLGQKLQEAAFGVLFVLLCLIGSEEEGCAGLWTVNAIDSAPKFLYHSLWTMGFQHSLWKLTDLYSDSLKLFHWSIMCLKPVW